jgi:hypothetical protein
VPFEFDLLIGLGVALRRFKKHDDDALCYEVLDHHLALIANMLQLAESSFVGASYKCQTQSPASMLE